MRANKYRAVKTTIDGITFDSKREAARYWELKWLQKAGVISHLELQPEFDFKIGGKKLFTYRADFGYFENGKRVVEDVKGVRTPVYRLKKKIVEAAFHITIKET